MLHFLEGASLNQLREQQTVLHILKGASGGVTQLTEITEQYFNKLEEEQAVPQFLKEHHAKFTTYGGKRQLHSEERKCRTNKCFFECLSEGREFLLRLLHCVLKRLYADML